MRRLDRATYDRVIARLGELAADPLSPQHSKPLRGGGSRRSARVGNLRIVFTLDATAREVVVSRIGPRGRVYRDR